MDRFVEICQQLKIDYLIFRTQPPYCWFLFSGCLYITGELMQCQFLKNLKTGIVFKMYYGSDFPQKIPSHRVVLVLISWKLPKHGGVCTPSTSSWPRRRCTVIYPFKLDSVNTTSLTSGCCAGMVIQVWEVTDRLGTALLCVWLRLNVFETPC